MIKELLSNWGKVNLFTCPRRFGKSINMSMLKYFFEIGTEKSLFDGLKIADEEIGIIIEVKYAENVEFEQECDKALKQINDIEVLAREWDCDNSALIHPVSEELSRTEVKRKRDGSRKNPETRESSLT